VRDKQGFAQEAKEYTKRYCHGKDVWLTFEEQEGGAGGDENGKESTDRYGRLLAFVWVPLVGDENKENNGGGGGGKKRPLVVLPAFAVAVVGIVVIIITPTPSRLGRCSPPSRVAHRYQPSNHRDDGGGGGGGHWRLESSSSSSSSSRVTLLLKDEVEKTEKRISLGTTAATTAAPVVPLLAMSALSSLFVGIPVSSAAAAASTTKLSEGNFDPNAFRPVCGASDSFYRLLQSTTRAAVGDEGMAEFGPLIAGGLLRIRLELCVVESFFSEAVGPFVRRNGLNWVLPIFREFIEGLDLFVGRYLVLIASGYIILKFVHFKVFPDFP
jgi:hypothetical protein